MTLKNGTKFKEKLTRGLKNYIRNLINFHASSRKSGKLHFDVFLLSKEYKFLMNKNRRVISQDTEKEGQIWEKLTLCSKSNPRSLVYFNASSGKSEKLHFDAMCHNTVEWWKIWRETDFCFKNDLRNLASFDKTFESLKICTLMGSVWQKYKFELK